MLDTLATILGFLINSGLVGPALLFFSGAAVGAWFYRYMLKRDPAKLELWAKEANALAEIAKKKALS